VYRRKEGQIFFGWFWEGIGYVDGSLEDWEDRRRLFA
jgi:hypothetical protein